MAIYKKLLGSDVSITPFNANKLFTFNSSSGTNLNIKLETHQYRSESLYTYSTNDVSSSLKYFQLDHLYYKDFQLNVVNKFGNVDYLNQSRELHDKVNTISIPSKLYGLEIKPGTFSFTTGSLKVVDDKNGNLIISGTQLISHSIDIRQKVFHLGPRNAFKQYDLNSNFYGKEQKHPHPLFYYNRKDVYDNSFYNNLLNYKNVKFSKKVISTIERPTVHFVTTGSNSISSSIVSPHSEKYNFNTGDNTRWYSFFSRNKRNKNIRIFTKCKYTSCYKVSF